MFAATALGGRWTTCPLTFVDPPGGLLGSAALRIAALNFFLSAASSLHSDDV